jgi:hypothetical protein
MMKTILIALVILLLAGLGMAEQIRGDQVLTKNIDGEYVVIFGVTPGMFFDGSGFSDPVTYVNGVAKIGSVGDTIIQYPIEDGE